ncbi:hypothetical protein VZ94_18430 [Methylocucumis oryzae]|uniref:Uncharacterized protein n=1 Tax=Methylocucumis oryzae TaxID=1632867 RepID=A0A0F3IFF0_9GAMM|nr:hypothetical protein VZ94_18430 [Methylocucumis oryzae]
MLQAVIAQMVKFFGLGRVRCAHLYKFSLKINEKGAYSPLRQHKIPNVTVQSIFLYAYRGLVYGRFWLSYRW